MTTYHVPVLGPESVAALDIQPEGVYVDATFGGGGHSRLILEKLGPKGRLLAFDQDEDALHNVPEDERLLFCPANFRYLRRYMRYHGIEAVDGILADLGVSSHQLDEAERGFSYRFDAPLDMRMNRREGPTAADLLNTLEEKEIQDLLSRYGEVRNARTVARRLVEARERKPITTTGELVALLEPLVRGHKPRYLSQVFQALRIAVNRELEVLEEFLQESLEALRPGGRLVVITYHSLEDRLVKRFMRTGNVRGEEVRDFYGNLVRAIRPVTKKPVEPSPEEIAANPRARSARLRVGERVLERKGEEEEPGE
ncbi:MAG: 16S rRNA (cytosine(1402)-N(4))-methyltransferase RsmH [Bacteroidetes bacterium]|nr:MAG: 16S rRNA (cytosine(1402)-N(4))-methyltransferase RsmH [Bacteroidota bacterium]